MLKIKKKKLNFAYQKHQKHETTLDNVIGPLILLEMFVVTIFLVSSGEE